MIPGIADVFGRTANYLWPPTPTVEEINNRSLRTAEVESRKLERVREDYSRYRIPKVEAELKALIAAGDKRGAELKAKELIFLRANANQLLAQQSVFLGAEQQIRGAGVTIAQVAVTRQFAHAMNVNDKMLGQSDVTDTLAMFDTEKKNLETTQKALQEAFSSGSTQDNTQVNDILSEFGYSVALETQQKLVDAPTAIPRDGSQQLVPQVAQAKPVAATEQAPSILSKMYAHSSEPALSSTSAATTATTATTDSPSVSSADVSSIVASATNDDDEDMETFKARLFKMKPH